MKRNFFFSLIGFVTLSVLFVSCNNDDDSSDPKTNGANGTNGNGSGVTVTLDTLKNLITEANELKKDAKEGFDLGSYAFGSITKLNDVIAKAQQVVDAGSTDEALLKEASDEIKKAISDFNNAKVKSIANPWVQQARNNKIVLTDNIEGDGQKGKLLSLIDMGKSFTIEFDIFPVSFNKIGNDNAIIGASKQFSDGQTVDDGFYVRYNEKGEVFYEIGKPDAGWESTGYKDGGLKAGEWNHVAYIHKGADQLLYVNKVEVFKTTIDYQSITNNPDSNVVGIHLGGAIDWDDRTANALFKDVRVWSKALDKGDLDKEGLTSTGDGLEVWFPMAADQGKKFNDVSGKFTAHLTELTVWAPDGDYTKVPVDYSDLEALISEAQTFVSGVNEGTNAGDFGVGTKEWFNPILKEAQDVISNQLGNADAKNALGKLKEALDKAKDNKVVGGAAGGFTNESDNGALRITPTFHSEGESYTAEFQMKLKDFGGDYFGTGEWGLISNGDGGLYYFISNDGYDGIRTTATLALDQWYHIALTYDKATKEAVLYVDSVEVGKVVRENKDNHGWGETWLGATWGFSKAHFKNLRIWNNVKTANQLNAPIANPTTEANLELYFPLDVKNATLFKDATGKYFGEMRGAASWLD